MSELSVKGFRFAGLRAGIKKREGLDLGLIVADEPVPAAALFTTNRVKAAPVLLGEKRLKGGMAQAVLVNSGCANACTGKPGVKAAEASTASVARALGIKPALVLPSSTGVIGQLLPAEKVATAAPALVGALRADAVDEFSRAIITTDKGPKVSVRNVKLGKVMVRVLGIAKGAGMIHPNMATTLCFVCTDAKVPAKVLERALREAAETTFNSISVDGDTSTNDTLLCLASGQAGNAALKKSGREYAAFVGALEEVLGELGAMIVADGEGAEHLVTFQVTGARNDGEAKKAAACIATSALVKTALHGKDPNWGRILAAAGRSGAVFDPDRADIHVGDVAIVKKGLAIGAEAEKRAHEIMVTPKYEITVKLGSGKGRAKYLTCDLGTEYVKVNADYRS